MLLLMHLGKKKELIVYKTKKEQVLEIRKEVEEKAENKFSVDEILTYKQKLAGLLPKDPSTCDYLEDIHQICTLLDANIKFDTEPMEMYGWYEFETKKIYHIYQSFMLVDLCVRNKHGDPIKPLRGKIIKLNVSIDLK